LKDGTVVESATFDVGEDLFVIGEDGSKTPAPDGEHELSLRDTEGNEVLIKVISKDGKIVERENVELADEETVKAEPLPGDETKKEEEMEAVVDYVEGNLPSTGDGVPADIEKEGPEIEIELGELVQKLAYRIEEMEKKIAKMEEVKEEVVDKEADIEEDLEEEELPKLDGAPTEPGKFSIMKPTQNSNKTLTAQERVWQRMYK
jgi:NADH dehydrogenase/NADH:ubiquinone oxidoreductase subunit G